MARKLDDLLVAIGYIATLASLQQPLPARLSRCWDAAYIIFETLLPALKYTLPLPRCITGQSGLRFNLDQFKNVIFSFKIVPITKLGLQGIGY